MEGRVTEAGRPDGRRDEAFRALVEPHRGALHAHCYRMLGSLHDADDALQDTLLRAWRSQSRYDPARPVRPWLYRIATNVCLDHLAKRPARALPPARGPAAKPADGPGEPLAAREWLEPYPDDRVPEGLAAPDARYEQRESVELAFVAALQHLPPRQRAVLIMREVLGYSAREVAETLETSLAAVNSALQRARKTVADELPDRSQQQTLRALGDEQTRKIVRRYVDAWESRNVDAMIAMLVHDATFAMPPHPRWFHGREDVVAFIAGAGTGPLRYVVTSANGQPAIAWYILDPTTESYRPASLEVLDLAGTQVRHITAFADPRFFPAFRLPGELPPPE